MKADTCVHYNGLLGGDIMDKQGLDARRCKAGVLYADVKEDGQGKGHRIPCVDSLRGAGTCPLHQYPTSEQLAERERQIAEHLARFAKVMNGDLKECLVCRAPVERFKEVRPCVYAEPCGHRQYQGKVPRSAP